MEYCWKQKNEMNKGIQPTIFQRFFLKTPKVKKFSKSKRYVFHLKAADSNNPRNGFLVLQKIEQAFHQKRLCFFLTLSKYREHYFDLGDKLLVTYICNTIIVIHAIILNLKR